MQLKMNRKSFWSIFATPQNETYKVLLKIEEFDLNLRLEAQEAMEIGSQLIATAAQFDREQAISHLTTAVDQVMRQGNAQ